MRGFRILDASWNHPGSFLPTFPKLEGVVVLIASTSLVWVEVGVSVMVDCLLMDAMIHGCSHKYMETKRGHLTLPLQIKTRLHHHRTKSQHRTWCGGICHDRISICRRCFLSLPIQRNCYTRHSPNHETLRRMGNVSSLWDHRNPRRKRQNIKNGVAFRRKTLSHQTHQYLPYNFRGRTLHTSRQ